MIVFWTAGGYISSMERTDIQRSVRQVVEQVVRLAKPTRVILFGSAAKGHAGSDSDLDFLVIVPDERDVREVTDRLNVGVRSRPMPCDFIVVTAGTLMKHHRTPGMIYGEVLEQGREVYVG